MSEKIEYVAPEEAMPGDRFGFIPVKGETIPGTIVDVLSDLAEIQWDSGRTSWTTYFGPVQADLKIPGSQAGTTNG